MENQNFHFGQHLAMILETKGISLEDFSDKITSASHEELLLIIEKHTVPHRDILDDFIKALKFKNKEEFLNPKLKVA